MATEVGSAYAKFTLDISGLRQGIKDAKLLLGKFKKDLEQDIVANIRVNIPNTVTMPRVIPNPNQGTPTSGTGGGGNNKPAADAETLARAEFRALVQARDYTAALTKLDQLLNIVGADTLKVARINGDYAQIERLANAERSKGAIFTAEAAAANGQYQEALVMLGRSLVGVKRGTEEWYAIIRSARGILKDETKEIRANADALIDGAKKRGQFNVALGLNQAAQAATTDPARKRTLESEEIDILAKLANENKLLANEAIDAALAQKDFFTATTLINRELASGTANVQREIALRELLAKTIRADTQARYDELDAITANKKQQGDTIGAFRNNATATAEAQRAPVQDDERIAQLARERIKLGQQLTQQQRAEADAAIRAATAQRDYWKALTEVQIQLELVDESSVRFSQLKAEEATLVRKIAGAMDDEAIATSRLQQSQSQHAAAIQTLRDAMVGLSAGSERQIRLQQELTNVELRARAVSEGIADTITAQMIAQKRYSDAIAYNTAKQAQVPSGPAGAQRRADLELELIQIQNAQAAADARKLQSNVKLARQLDDYTAAIKLLSAEQLKYLQTDKIWIDLETQKRAIMQQMENEIRKDADQAIRAAKADKDWAEAARILNIEQDRAMKLGDQRRLDQLQVTQQSIANAQGGGIFDQIFNGATKIIGPLAAGTIAFTAFNKAKEDLTEGSRIAAALELQTRQIGAMVDNVARGNGIIESAIAFGQKYAKTQEELGKAADEAGIILRTTTVEASRVFEVLARLQARAPGKDFGDAVRSITELQSGQLQSIERVFNVPKRFAQELNDAIQQGQDPIVALDAVLNKLGQTSAILDVQLTGPAKAFKDQEVAAQNLRIELGKLINVPLSVVAESAAKIENSLANAFKAARDLYNLQQQQKDAARINAGGPITPPPPTPKSAAGALVAENVGAFLLGGVPGVIALAAVKYLGLVGAAGKKAAADLKVGFDASKVSITQLRDEALKAAPALAGLIPGTKLTLTPAAEIASQADQINALINQYNEGTISADKLAAATRKLTNIKFGDDFLGIIQNVNNTTPEVTDRIDKLHAALIGVQQVMGAQQNPQLAARYIPEIVAIENQLKVLEAQSPIVITVEMRIEQMGTATAALDNIRKQIDQTQTAITKGNADIKRANEDFARQQHYAQVDHAQQMQKSRDDFNRQQKRSDDAHSAQVKQADADNARQRARSDYDYGVQRAQQQRDFDLQDARATEDHERAKLEKKKDRQKEEARAERDFLYNMQKMRRDFDINQARSQEDFELDKRKLLAEGRIKEAQILEERFNITKRRAGEDFGRSRSDAGDSFAQSRQDRLADQAEQDKQEDANFARERARRLADYKQQREDQQTAHDLQNKRADDDYKRTKEQQQKAYDDQRKQAGDDFERTQKEQETQFTEQQRRANEQHFIQMEAQRAAQTEQLNLLNKYLDDQREALEQAKRDQLEILALKTKGFTEEEAKAIVALQTAQREFDKSMAAFDKTAIDGGAKSALLYIENFAKTLLANVKPAVEDPLNHYGDYIKTKSPPKKGAFSTIDKDGYNTGKMWADNLAKGLAIGPNFTNTMLDAHNAVTKMPSLGDYRANPRNTQVWDVSGSAATANSQRHLTVTVPVALAMDGQIVGKLVTPHVADQLIDDLQVSVNVVDASQKIALTQSSFRGGPSVTRSGG